MKQFRRWLYAIVACAILTLLLPASAFAATHTWTGALNNLWSNPANWAEGTAPTEAGAVVVFGQGRAANLTNINDLVGVQLNQIVFNTSGYNISGNAITLNGTIDDAVTTGGTNTLALNITLAAATTITVANSGATLILSGSISGTGGVTKAGSGTLEFAAGVTHTYPGPTTLTAGTFFINSIQNSTINVTGGLLGGTGALGPLSATGGVVNPGTLSIGILNSGNVTFNAATLYSVQLNGTTAGTGYDQLNVAGTIDLGGATLNATFGSTSTPGNAFTIINNDGTDPIVGTFNGLAEGTAFALNGQAFRITYAGGDGNDVELINIPTISISNVSLSEGDTGTTAFTFTVTLNQASTQPVSVNFATANGIATAGSDYAPLTGGLIFNPGQTSQTIRVNVNGDTLLEPHETFLVNLSGATNAFITTNQAIGTILNDDAIISITDVTQNEGNSGATTFVFTLSLPLPSNNPVTVNFTTSDGTAIQGNDYGAALGTVTFAPGETTKSIGVQVQGEGLSEANETFAVILSNPVNATLASTQGTGTIVNDDGLLIINNVSLNEGSSGTTNATLTVTLANPSAVPITVNYSTGNSTAIAGEDYTATSGTLTFNPGETTKSIVVPIIGDTMDEDNETVVVNLSDANNAALVNTQGLITINDDDAQPGISINSISVPEGNSGTTLVTFTATLSAPSGKPIIVSYATNNGSGSAGNDYNSVNGALVFNPGETTKSIEVRIIGDAVDEENENFFLNLTNSVNATIANGLGTGLIQDDDGLPSLSISNARLEEGNSGVTNAVFTVVLSAPSGKTITVDFSAANGTATAGSDYTTTFGSLTFNPIQTSRTISVLVAGDTTVEPDETFLVTLTNETNVALARPQGAATIVNDDAVSALPELTVSLTSPRNGDALLRLPALLGNVAGGATGSAGLSVAVSIKRLSDNRYWSGNGWSTNSNVRVPANVAGNVWIVPLGLLPNGTALTDGKYLLTATAADNAGHTASATATITIDKTAPTVSITTPGENSATIALPLLAGSASDSANGSGVQRVIVILRRLSDGKYWNGTAWINAGPGGFALTTTLTGNEWSRRVLLPTGINLQLGRYRVQAIAIDKAGNRALDENTFRLAPREPSPVRLSTAQARVSLSSIEMRFSGPLDVETAADAEHYVVTLNGREVTVESAAYDSLNNMVTLSLPEGVLRVTDTIVVRWSGLSDLQGRLSAGLAAPVVTRATVP